MNDPLSVGGGESIRYLNADIEDLVDFHRLAAHPLFQAHPL